MPDLRRHSLLPLGALGSGLILLSGLALWAAELRSIDGFVVIALLQGALYAIATQFTPRGQGTRIFALILAVAVIMRVIAAASPVLLSTDINRYVWDGRVQAAGINPYRYVPNDPALTRLRDADVWPNINRASKAHTIYPPAAQMIYLAAQLGGSTRAAMKGMMILLEGIAIFALYRVLVGQGQPRERLLVYVWHPLPVWEIAGAGHIDAALIAFVSLALWAWQAGRQRWVGAALAAATLIKFFPLMLAPGLWGRAAWLRRDWRLPVTMLILIPLAYLPYLRVGLGVFGYLPGYAREEQLGSGSGLWLVDLFQQFAPIAPAAYLAAGAALLAWLGYRTFVATPSKMFETLRNLAIVFTFFVSPHYAWYFVWLIPLLTVTSADYLLWPTLTAFFLYWAPTPSQAPLWIGAVIYGGTAALSSIVLATGWVSRPPISIRE